jgi:hypothetical protein
MVLCYKNGVPERGINNQTQNVIDADVADYNGVRMVVVESDLLPPDPGRWSGKMFHFEKHMFSPAKQNVCCRFALS